MKLVDFETFIRMPAGTIFAPYTPCVLVEGLAIKTDTGRPVHLSGSILPPALNGTYSYYFNGVMSLTPCIGQDTNLFQVGDEEEARFEAHDGDNNDYCNYKMFLVFDEKDIDNLMEAIQWAKKWCK